MKPLPLRPRIIAALELAPMTRRQLARALCANPESVSHYVDELVGWRMLACAGVERRRNGRPRKLWRLA